MSFKEMFALAFVFLIKLSMGMDQPSFLSLLSQDATD